MCFALSRSLHTVTVDNRDGVDIIDGEYVDNSYELMAGLVKNGHLEWMMLIISKIEAKFAY